MYPKIGYYEMVRPELDSGETVKEQYVGDIHDFRKYALLRLLASGGATPIGVCWMLTPAGEGTDGNKLGYLSKPDQYRAHDPELFDLLAQVAGEPDKRRLQSIEDSGIVPGASYFNEVLPQSVDLRAAYMADCKARFADTGLVFFDPDNGIEVASVRPGREKAVNYVFSDELTTIYDAGKSVLVYQHRPKFMTQEALEERCWTVLRRVAPDAHIWVFVSADVSFFLVVHPNSPARLAMAATQACEHFDPKFIRSKYLSDAK